MLMTNWSESHAAF